LSDTADYAALFLADAPMIDTRAPVEFARGSFPAAENLPLMTDDERARVGTCYKQRGQQAAIELGHRLVCGVVKQRRVEAWLDFTRRHPEGYLFCFRGGLRSRICQQWVREAGCDYPRIQGGYKAMRRFLIDTLEAESTRRRFILLAGHTGAAKTALLEQIPNSIDLEGMAHHRGSAFGRRPGGQPSQISFENRIGIALLKQACHFGGRATILEDEGHLIGKCHIPEPLRTTMAEAPLVVLEVPFAEPLEHSFRNYVLEALWERQAFYGEEQGFRQFAGYLRQSLFNIRRRLGGARHEELRALLEEALENHQRGEVHGHRRWIGILLQDYYDPMYSYQLGRKRDRVIFSGDAGAVREYLREV
jgi:tRNA 2-selenouridine synthase